MHLFRNPKLFLEWGIILFFFTAVALYVANVHYDWYHHFVHHYFFTTTISGLGVGIGSGVYGINLHWCVEAIGISLFFLRIGIELKDETLPGGRLSTIRKATVPAIMALGGVVVPALIYGFLAYFVLDIPAGKIMVIPTATDIVYARTFMHLLFGSGVLMGVVLVTIAVVDDIVATVLILFLFTTNFYAESLFWTLTGILLAYGMNRMGVRNFMAYLLVPGTLCWFGVAHSGIHPSLGLFPLAFLIPHKQKADAGYQENTHYDENDTAHRMEEFLHVPIDLTLALFAFCNAGIVFGDINSEYMPFTLAILGALVVGKVIGIAGFGMIASKIMGLKNYLSPLEMLTVGAAGAVGFTMVILMLLMSNLSGDYKTAGNFAALLSLPAALILMLVLKVFLKKPTHK